MHVLSLLQFRENNVEFKDGDQEALLDSCMRGWLELDGRADRWEVPSTLLGTKGLGEREAKRVALGSWGLEFGANGFISRLCHLVV